MKSLLAVLALVVLSSVAFADETATPGMNAEGTTKTVKKTETTHKHKMKKNGDHKDEMKTEKTTETTH